MATRFDRVRAAVGHHRAAAFVGTAVTLGAFGLSGCGVMSAVGKVAHAVKTNKDTIDAFTKNIAANGSTTFEATYVTTGSSPTTVVYAVKPPTGLAFSNAPTATANDAASATLDVIVNSSGEYTCVPSSDVGSGTGRTCERLQPTTAKNENKIFSFYTPTYWATFLRDFSLAAGFAGDSVSSSKMPVNGFAMQCVDFKASGVPSTSTICTTAQGILGYVKVASNATSFELTHYSTSPPASLFELPAGAKVTTVTIPTTT